MSKMSSVLVGMCIMAGIAIIFTLAIAENSENYGSPVDEAYQNQSLKIYDKSSKLADDLEQTREDLAFKADSGFFSQLDAMLTKGFSIMVILSDSVDLTNTMIDESIDQNPLLYEEAKPVFKALGVAIVLIVVLIGILISTLTKREQ